MMRACPTALLSLVILLTAGAAVQAQATAPDNPPQIQPRDARLSGYPYPYPVAMFPLQSQGQALEMAYMDVPPIEGAPATGRTVVLMHGKNFSSAYWTSTIAALNERGFRVIAPDQIGFGKSSKPLDFQYSFHQLADHTRQLLDHLDLEKVDLVGHSMGGMLATRFALMYPERTVKLALVNPIGLEDWKRFVPYTPIDQQVQAELRATPESIRKYFTDSYFDGQWQPHYNALLDVQAGWAVGPDKEITARAAALTFDMVMTQPVLYEFPDLKVPTLLIIGQRDRTALGKAAAKPDVAARLGNYPQLGQAAAKAIPGAELVELEGVGHIPQYEAFDAYMAALANFLR